MICDWPHMNPLVSIVIPYYNGARFVREAVVSAISQSYENIEVILVDDGSTESASIEMFDNLEHVKLKKFRTINQGLAMARNSAISMAKGEIILPLDCDDIISNTYVESGVAQFRQNDNLGIVYSKAVFFGAHNGYWDLPNFNLYDFLINNCIFCSAMFWRKDWLAVGGYKADMKYGLEDYDFWLSILELEREVYQLPDVHFFYRKHGASMISSMSQDKLHYSYEKIIHRHQAFYKKHAVGLIGRVNELRAEVKQLSAHLSTQKLSPSVR